MLKWIQSLFRKDEDTEDCKCDRCGYMDEEANVCGDCLRTICDGCMCDFIANQCIDCCSDIEDEDE